MVSNQLMRCFQNRFYGISVCCWLSLASSLFAGDGAENLVLVINAESLASQTIANEYIALRGIPENRVIYLNNLSSFEAVNVNV